MSVYRKGSNGFTQCDTCGMPGHLESDCPLKDHYHRQAQIQLMRGSRDPEILREVYGQQLEKAEPFQC